MLGAGKNTIEIILAARDRTQAAFTKVNAQMRTLGGSTTKLNTGMGSLRTSFTNLRGSAGKLGAALGPLGLAAVAVAAAVAIASIGVSAVRSFAEFEDAMASVRKTTGFTKSEIKVLGDAINTLALRIPVAQTELAGIAAVAGQLGIQGKEDILSFTETVAMMTTAFDMSAESVAIAMAKLGKIYDIPIEQTSNLGSAINVLGNTTAASESQIMAFSMALGPAAQQLGFAATEAISLGASMISMGMDASSAGTRLNRAFSMIGRNLEELAEFMEMPVDEFVQSFEEMPMDTFLDIIDKLSQVEGKLKANTIAAEIFGEIGAKGIKSIAEDIDGVRTNLANSNEQFRENTSLAEEFAAKTDTLNAKFQIFGNTVESFKIQIGEALAPLTGKLTEVATVAVKGLGLAFDAMMKLAGPALDLIFIKIKLLRAFMEGLFTPIIRALAPLMNSLNGISGGFGKLKGVITLVSDVVTILTSAATKLGSLLGNLLVKVLTPLIAKTQEGISTASDIYDKLGPIKGAIESVTGAIHDLAEAEDASTYDTKAVMDSVDEMTASLEDLEASAVSAPTAIIKAWKTATDAFEEGTGSMKDAASEINKEIEVQIGLWKQAADADKFYYEDNLRHLGKKLRATEEADKAERDYLATFIDGTTKAIEKQKDFIVTIGDTTIEFKGAAAEVLKNADAYEKLQKAAKTFTDLDWSVFHDFEAALPNINTGIGDMESAFVGFSSVLEDNIGKLENIKESVMGISEIAAPFLEAGFLNGIKAISDFAGALKNAGSAIHDFTSLQDVSIDGAINFSLHVRGMVRALEILEGQMEDLVPVFGDVDSLITDIADAFLYGGDKAVGFFDSFDSAISSSKGILDSGAENFNEFKEIVEKALDVGELTYLADTYITESDLFQKKWKTITVENARDVERAMHGWLGGFTSEFETTVGTITAGTEEISDTYRNATMHLHNWVLETYGVRISQEKLYEVMQSPPEEQKKWLDEIMHSEKALTFQMDKQTNALKAQTEQLSKITDALQPYLNFMRTLNELAALSTLSTAELNAGLNSIKDTLVNLGTALTDFDLRSAMEGLFAADIGSAKGFMDVMIDYNADFGLFAATLARVTEVILNLSTAIENAAGMVVISSHEMEDAMRLIPAQLEEIETFLRTDLWGQIVAMLFAVNVEWEKFEDILETTSFSKVISTISNLIGLMESMKGTVTDTGEQVVISAYEMESVLALIPDQLEEIEKFLMSDLWGRIVAMIFAVNVQWEKWAFAIEDMDFTKVTSILSSLMGLMDSMKATFADVSEQVVMSAGDIETAMDKVDDQLEELELYLMSASWDKIVTMIFAVGVEWQKDAKIIDEYMPSFNAAVDTISTLASKVVSLSTSLIDLRDMSVLSVRDIDEALKNIPVFLDGFVDALRLNMDAIKQSLKELDVEWQKHAEEMEDTMPSYETSTESVGKLIGSLLSLQSALVSLSETGTISERAFDRGFKSLMKSISNFAVSLGNNVEDLIFSLQKLRVVWVENEAVLLPLMKDFAIITDNLWGVAHNANRMAKEFSAITKNSKTLEKGFASLITFINQVVDGVKRFYTTEVAAEIARFIEDIDGVIGSFIDLEIELKGAMSTIKKAIGGAVDNIKGRISSLSTLSASSFWWGVNMMKSFITGIYAMSPALAIAAAAQAAIVQAFLGVASPTKLGPLSHLDEWPRNLIQSYSAGIESEMHTLNSSFAGLAPGMSAASPAGGNKTFHLHLTQNIGNRSDAMYSVDEIKRLMIRHEVM